MLLGFASLRANALSPPDHEQLNEEKKDRDSKLYFSSTISDTPLIDHLVNREFVSGQPSYRSIHKKVRNRKPSLRESS